MTKHTSFRLRLLAGLAALAAIMIPVLVGYAQTTATMYTDGTNFGIGTTGPTQKLQVVGTVAATAFSGDGSALTNISAGGWTDGGTNVYTSTTTDNVGIGTTTPSTKLEVAVSGASTSFEASSGTNSNFAIDHSSAGINFYINGNSGAAVPGDLGLGFSSTFENTPSAMHIFKENGNIGFGTTNPLGALTVMNGNVGIGTWNPGSRLNIIGGNIGIGTTTQYRRIAAPTNGMAIEGNVGIGTWATNTGKFVVLGGNVGIGTSSPNSIFEVSDPAAPVSRFWFQRSGGGGSVLSIQDTGDNPWNIWQGHTTNSLAFYYNVNATPTLDMDSNGNVGIGVESAGGSLVVANGNVGIGTNTPVAGTAIMNGNVGIGTWNPIDALSIVGNIGIGTTTPYRRISGPTNGMAIEGNVGIGTWAASEKLIVMGGNVGVGTVTPVGALAVMNGNVGIGTWSPTQRLQVVGTVAATAFTGDGSGLTGISAGGWTDGGTNVYEATTTDLVGIGTTSPSTTLEIVQQSTNPSLMVSSVFNGDGNLLIVHSGGNVGIGTVQPIAKAVVENTGAIDSFRVNDVTADSSPFVIDQNGNVGIGTTTSAFPLSVVSATAGDVIMVQSTNAGGISEITFKDNAGISSGFIGYSNSSGNLFLETNGTHDMLFYTGSVSERMRITTGGNVGIGTSSANVALLNVNGETYIAGPVGMGTFTPTGMLDVRQDEVRIWTGGGTDTNATSAGELYVEGDLEADGTIYGDGSGLTAVGSSVGAGGWVDAGAIVFQATTTDKVGIGTTNPSTTLEIVQQSTNPSLMVSSVFNGDGDLLIIHSGGNVGIGTVQPIAKAVVENTGAIDSFRVNDVTADSSPFVIDQNGAVGIGTTTTASTLTMVGNIGIGTTTPYRMIAGPSNGMAIEGNVGIGTWAAANGKLIVMGGNVGIGSIIPGNALSIKSSSGLAIVNSANFKAFELGTNSDYGVMTVKDSGGTTRVTVNTWDASGPYIEIEPNTGAFADGTSGSTPWLGAGLRVAIPNAVGGENGIGFGDGTFSNTPVAAITGYDEDGGIEYGSGGLKFKTHASGGTFLTKMTIKGDGSVGIGTTTPINGLAVMNGKVGIGTWSPVDTLFIKGNIGIGTTLPYLSIAAPNNGMVVEGNVGIGTWNPSQKVHIVGNLRVQGSTDCTLGNGAGATNCSSDIRLKENVKEIQDPLRKILTLRGVEFDWNEKAVSPGRHDIGVIAQDVEKVFPTAVVEDAKGYKMLDYAVLVAPLIEAVKELNHRMDDVQKNVLTVQSTDLEQLREENKKIQNELQMIKSMVCRKDPDEPFCRE